MTLTELRYIVTLASEKHFGRAAEKCHVSQPTLSVGVKRLEQELGVTLFERYKGQVSVTDQGQALIQQAEQVLRQSHVLRDLAEHSKHPLRSPLRVGAIYTIGPYLYPALMPEIYQQAPELPLYIEESFTSVLREKLNQSELDAILIALPFDEAEIQAQALYDEPFVVLLPARHPLCDCETISADQLDAEKLLLLGPGHCLRDQVLEACPGLFKSLSISAENDPRGRLITEGSSLETIRHMVAGGLGITVLPLSAAMSGTYGEERLQVRPFAGAQPYRTVALAWRASFPRTQAIALLAQSARRVIAQQQPQCRVYPTEMSCTDADT